MSENVLILFSHLIDKFVDAEFSFESTFLLEFEGKAQLSLASSVAGEKSDASLILVPL